MAGNMNDADKSRLKELAEEQGDEGVLPRVLLEIADRIEKLQQESRKEHIILACIGVAILATLILGAFF